MAPVARRAQSARVAGVKRFLGRSAFLFDLDGTLLDSSSVHEKVFREVLADHAPHCLGGFDYEPLKGKSTAESFRHLGIVESGALAAMVTEKQRRYRAAVAAGELRLMPGAREILELLQRRRKRLFVVTGGSRRSVEAALDATGVRAFFEDVIAADDVACGKPAPDGFLLCLERSGVPAAQAVGIEDSISGLEACRAAGLDAVLVNNPRLQKTFQPAFPSLVEFRGALIHHEEFARV
jgi:HAD superfamily hydrolase (TIGR01509 family)